MTINCPACNEFDVDAASYDEEIIEKLLHLIPIHRLKRGHVVCGRCKADMISSTPLDELAAMPSSERAFYLRHDPGLVPKFLAVAALLCAVFPIVGTILSAIALLVNYRYRSWASTVSKLALGVSFIPLIFFVAVLVMESFRVAR